MPRILRIINRLNLGGPTYNAAYLTRYLSPSFETKLVAGMKDDTEESSEFIVKKMGIEPVYIPEMKREIDPRNDRIAYTKIKKLIKEFKPDIVHTHASKAGTIGRMAAINTDVPVIVHTFHGHVFHSYFNPFSTRIFLEIERYLARRSSAIIAISELQKYELVETHKVCSDEKVRIIPLGFDLQRFRDNQQQYRQSFRTRFGINDEVAIGIVGRLVPIKNHDLFLNAIKRLKEETSAPFKAVIIGDGVNRTHLEKFSRELKLENEVIFTSWIKNVEFAMAGLDIVALTSLNEGTPVSLIEAQAAGKPVVTTKVGGIANVVNNDITGFLVDSFDPTSFAHRLKVLVENETLRNQMGSKGWDFISQKFHYQRLVSDVSQLYNELLNKEMIPSPIANTN